MTKTPNKLLDDFFAKRDEVFKLFEYEENWRVFPVEDHRGEPWMLVGGEGYKATCVWSDEPFTEKTLNEGKVIYGGSVYTQRHLTKWVYRTPTHVMVLVDTQTDGNIILKVFDANLECTDDRMRNLYLEFWDSP